MRTGKEFQEATLFFAPVHGAACWLQKWTRLYTAHAVKVELFSGVLFCAPKKILSPHSENGSPEMTKQQSERWNAVVGGIIWLMLPHHATCMTLTAENSLFFDALKQNSFTCAVQIQIL